MVPAILAVGPLRDFIRPAMTVLRSTQAFRLRRAVEHGLSPRPPHQPPQRRRIDGPLSLGRNGKQPALPFHHNGTRLVLRRAYQSDPRRPIAFRYRANPFSPSACFPKAPPRQDRKSDGWGKGWTEELKLGGARYIKKKK